jgi:hypothetical protein
MPAERDSLSSATADPGAIGLSLFGFALFLVLAIGKGQASHEATPAPAGLSAPVTSN